MAAEVASLSFYSGIPQLNIAPATTALPPNLAGTQVTVWRDDNDNERMYGHEQAGQYWLDLPGLANFHFGPDTGVITADAYEPKQAELIFDAYRRVVLPLALQALGGEVLHASAVRLDRGVIAFCADSETGKSTLAYSFSQHGYPLWADDAVGWQLTNSTALATPLPFALRLHGASAEFFNHPASELPGADDPQIEQIVPTPLSVLVILERVTAPGDAPFVQIERLDQPTAFVGLLAHSYCFDLQYIERKRLMMARYLELAARVPTLKVNFGNGLDKLPFVMDRILEFVNDLTKAK